MVGVPVYIYYIYISLSLYIYISLISIYLSSFSSLEEYIVTYIRLSIMDVLVPSSMKNAAKCDS